VGERKCLVARAGCVRISAVLHHGFKWLLWSDLLLLGCAVHACVMPDNNWPTDIENINSAPVVLLGEVIRQYPSHGRSTYYTAEMDVFCILKGDPVPSLINITHAGFDPEINDCWPIELKAGATYIVTVDEDLRALYPSVPIDKFKEVLRACGLNKPTYPAGIIQASMDCPKPLPSGQCSPR